MRLPHRRAAWPRENASLYLERLCSIGFEIERIIAAKFRNAEPAAESSGESNQPTAAALGST
jgi:hypothetical protein